MKEKFQSFGKAMLVPITLIAISGLFLGIGSVFTTELTLVSLYGRGREALYILIAEGVFHVYRICIIAKT